jgi:hypothetical protein
MIFHISHDIPRLDLNLIYSLRKLYRKLLGEDFGSEDLVGDGKPPSDGPHKFLKGPGVDER